MKTYYFVFCKEDLLLEKTPDGGYTIPLQEEPPTAVKPWTNIMNITPLDGVEVKTYRIDAPITDDERYEMCGLRQHVDGLNGNDFVAIILKFQEIFCK